MRVALVSEWKCDSRAEWSGTPYYAASAIRSILGPIVTITPPAFAELSGTIEQRLRTIGAFTAARLAEERIEAALFLGMAPLPYCDAPCVRIVWHDSTWFGLMTRHGVTWDHFRSRWPALHDWDLAALSNAHHIFLTSRWAHATAAGYMNGGDRLQTLPFGVNIDEIPSAADVLHAVSRRSHDEIRILFVGKDWRRKGLHRAIATVDEINHRGCRARLTVVGVDAGPALGSPNVVYEGIIEKDQPSGRERFAALLSAHHLLLHPASFECFGIAPLEANAFGVPVIATDRGGLTCAIQDGITGRNIPIDAFPSEAATIAIDLVSDPNQYLEMALACHERVRTTHNWPALVSELARRTGLTDGC